MAMIFQGLELSTIEGLIEAKRRLAAESHINNELYLALLDKQLQEKLAADEPDLKSITDHLDQMGEVMTEIQQLKQFLEARTPKPVDLAEVKISDREWIWYNYIPRNKVTLFTGQGGVGKSRFALQVVCQTILGFHMAFLDPEFKPKPKSEYDDSDIPYHLTPKNIVFATYEDEPEEIKRRLNGFSEAMPWAKDGFDKILERFHVLNMDACGPIWGPGIGKHIAVSGELLPAGQELRITCEKKKADLLVIDPLSGAFGNNENDRSHVYNFVSDFAGWARETQCAVLLIGHLPKSAEGKAAGFSGSTAWEASIRSMVKLGTKTETTGTGKDKQTDEYFALEHLKSSYARRQRDVYLKQTDTGWWERVATKAEAIQAHEDYETRFETQEDTEDDEYADAVGP